MKKIIMPLSTFGVMVFGSMLDSPNNLPVVMCFLCIAGLALCLK